MARVFISYRRDDSADVTGRIYDWISARLGAESVFRDVDDIPFGVDFKQYLEDVVAQTSVMLVVIGPQWASITDNAGRRRFDDPRDFVRIEVETALKRNMPVIPLLVSGATMPDEAALPPTLANLTYRNGLPIRRDPDFRTDMERLIKALEGMIKPAGEAKQNSVSTTANIAFEMPMLEWCSVPTSNLVAPFGIVRVQAFQMSKYPVTNAQFQLFIDAPDGYQSDEWWKLFANSRAWHQQHTTAAESQFVGKDLPRENVNWFEAVAFCQWLSAKLKLNITLPGDLQWSLAAQGAGKQEYPWGNGFDRALCNTKESGLKRTTPIDRYPQGASPYGVYDMFGNVWEWTLTEHATRTDSISSDLERTIRGCSWHDFQTNVRSAARGTPIHERTGDLGFRLVALTS